MSIDEVVETISKMEKWDDIQRIARVLKNRSNHLNQAAMQRVKQKFKMGDRIRIKDEKGEYHSGFFYGVVKKKVRFHIYDKEMKVSPVNFERLEPEVIGQPESQGVHKMKWEGCTYPQKDGCNPEWCKNCGGVSPEEVKKREDAVDKMLRKK